MTLPPNDCCPLCTSGASVVCMQAPNRFHLRRQLYKLMRCDECECVWLIDPPKSEEKGAHYSKDYHRAIAAAGEGSVDERWRRHRKLIYRHKQGGTNLDIGCSSGGAFLGKLKGRGWKPQGIEMERFTADKARQSAGAEVFVGDAMNATFAPNSFDAITTFDVLESMYDPRALLLKMKEGLKPAGMWFTMVTNIDSVKALAFGSYWYGLELPRHTLHFSPHSLKGLTTSLRFEEIQLATPPECYVEHRFGYLCAAGLERIGLAATPQSQQREMGLTKRIVRKVFRVAVLLLYAALAPRAGAAASIEGMFAKPG